jgi:hypothetical protein
MGTDVRAKGEEIRMSHIGTQSRSYRRLRAIAVIPALTIALIVPVKPAHADCVTANANGIAHSNGAAAVAATAACQGDHGQSGGSAVGRKVG